MNLDELFSEYLFSRIMLISLLGQWHFTGGCVRPESHFGLRSRLNLARKRLESRLSYHLMTGLEVFMS